MPPGVFAAGNDRKRDAKKEEKNWDQHVDIFSGDVHAHGHGTCLSEMKEFRADEAHERDTRVDAEVGSAQQGLGIRKMRNYFDGPGRTGDLLIFVSV